MMDKTEGFARRRRKESGIEVGEESRTMKPWVSGGGIM